MRKLLALALGLALVAGLAWGDAASYKQVAVTDAAQTVNLAGASVLTIVNGGANIVYFRLFKRDENVTAAVATAAGGIYLPSGASLEYSTGSYGSISLICGAGLTATVHLYLD